MGFTTNFVGVDADAIGQGDATETLPPDTWLQRRIQNNNERLLAPPVALCWSPISGSASNFTSFAGIRPYCADVWHTLWRGYVQVVRDQTQLRITLAYHADTPGSTTMAGTVQFRVMCSDGTDTLNDGTTLAATYVSGVKTGHQTISVDLRERVQRNDTMRVTLLVRSNSSTPVSTGIGSAGTGITNVCRHQHPYRLRDTALTAAPGFFDPNSAGTPPDGDSLEAMYLSGGTHPTWGSAAGARYDMLYTADNGSQGTIAGTVQEVVAASSQVDSSMTALMHMCLMLRAIAFRPGFGGDFAIPASAVLPASTFAPNQEFGASEAVKQAAAVIRAYRTPTIAMIGPRGRVGDTGFTESDLDRFAANGYAVHWPTMLASFDNTTSGESRMLINEGFYCRTENPILELRCTWLSIQHGAQWDAHQIESDVKGSDKNVRGLEGPGKAIWTMTASVHQLTNPVSGSGSWATNIEEYGTLSESVHIPVWGADVVGADPEQPPVLRGIDSMVATGKSDVTDPGFWFKEGSLFGADLPLLKETSHMISLADMTQAVTLLPMRLKVEMALSDFVNPVQIGPATATLQERLRLTLVSCTLIEHPEDP